MRVLHVIDSGGLYGAERMLLTLIGVQRRQGIDATLLSLGRGPAEAKPLEAAAARAAIPCESLCWRGRFDWRGWSALRQRAASDDLAIVHSHGYKPNIVLAAPPRSARRARHVVTIHGWTGSGSGDRVLRFYERLDRWMLSRCDAVVIVSAAQRREPAVARCGATVELIPNGIAEANTAPPEPLDPALESFVAAGPTLVSVGRLSFEKGYDLLLDALAQVGTTGNGARLVVLGDGPQRARLEAHAQRLGLGDRVRWLGYQDDTRPLLARATLYVQPSRQEGLPLAVLEAMQFGAAIVATAVGDVPELLDQGAAGALVARGDASALARAIEALLVDPARRQRLGVAARDRVRAHYGADTMERRYRELYARLLGAVDPAPQSGSSP